MLKRIQDKPSSILTDQFALALGGIAVVSKNPQILYCRDTFDHPTLIENESICDEFGESFRLFPTWNFCLCVSLFSVLVKSSDGEQGLFSPALWATPPLPSPKVLLHKASSLPGQPLFARVKGNYLEFVVQCRVWSCLVDLEIGLWDRKLSCSFCLKRF